MLPVGFSSPMWRDIMRALLLKIFCSDYPSVSWVTYTSSELVQVGLNEGDARKKYGDTIKVLSWPDAGNDRAQAEGSHAV
jgi:pyruvate/2-oxoglutarate dehydrogenase complex dihydrolipoamide dehydrogenase (E3) component